MVIIVVNPSNKNFCKVISLNELSIIKENCEFCEMIWKNIYVIPKNYEEVNTEEIRAPKDISYQLNAFNSLYQTSLSLLKQNKQKTL